MKTESQKNQILKTLMKGQKITPHQALRNFGCFRLGARIYELKKEGWPIESEIIEVKTWAGRNLVTKRVARYYITNEALIKLKKS